MLASSLVCTIQRRQCWLHYLFAPFSGDSAGFITCLHHSAETLLASLPVCTVQRRQCWLHYLFALFSMHRVGFIKWLHCSAYTALVGFITCLHCSAYTVLASLKTCTVQHIQYLLHYLFASEYIMATSLHRLAHTVFPSK